MSEAALPADPDDPLPGLLATEARLVAKLERVRRAITALDPTHNRNAVTTESPARDVASSTGISTFQALPPCPEEFRGLSVLQASLRELASIKRPIRTKDIATSLKERGFPAATDDLERNIAAAFRDHSKKKIELIRVADGAWALREWYSRDDLEAILVSQDSYKRSERTKEGIEVARTARGVRVGREKIATPEKIEEVRKLLRAGKSVREAGEIVGLKPSTIYRDIRGGAAGLRESEDRSSELRVVK